MMPAPDAIAIDLADARTLAEASASPLRVLSMAPDAAVFLRETGHEAVDLEDVTTAFSHARNLVRSTRYLNAIEAQLLDLDWNPGVVEGVRIFLFNFIPPLLLLQKALAACSPDNLSLAADGTMLTGLSRSDAFLALAKRLSRSFDAHLPATGYGRLHAGFCHLANGLVLRLLGNRPTIYQLDHATPFTQRVCRQLADANPEAAIISIRHPGKTGLASLRRTAKSIHAALSPAKEQKEIRLFRAHSGQKQPGAREIQLPRLIPSNACLDEAVRRGVTDYLPRIRMDAEAGTELARRDRPSILVLDHLIQPSVYQAARNFARVGVPSVMINHGSDTAQKERLAELGAELWARHGRVNMPGLNTLLCKSPLTPPLATAVLDNNPSIYGINIGKPHRRAEPREDGFLVVMAGNYRELHGHVPYVSETPGEFLRGLLEFSRAAAQVDGLRLLIKLKPRKTGFPFEWLKKTLEDDEFNGQVQIDTTTPFNILFETMDLLAGNNSATLQEALDNRIPVFLNTWRRLYRHFPARLTPPTGDERSAAYAVYKSEDLVPMLTAIRDSHRQRLTDRELDGYSWTEDDLAKTQKFLGRALAGNPNKN